MVPEKWEACHSKVTDEGVRRLSHWRLRVFKTQDEQLEERWLAILNEWLEAHAEALGQAGQQV
jgi:hypothetical protein